MCRPQAAAADLIGAARGAGGPNGIAGIFLDGENAWEAYPRRGADFLDALYARLEEEAATGRARARTISESLAERGAGAPLPRLHSGSWIDSAFRIWIGDPDKNLAWAQLGRARAALARAEAKHDASDERQLGIARRLLLAAEGSDWFWWYGEPFSSAEDPIFDELFRAHLEASWRALGEEPPSALAEPIGKLALTGRRAAATGFIRPCIDGKADRFYEWHGAALFEVGRGGAMADSGHPIDRVFVGFDEEQFYLRIDPAKRDRRRVACRAPGPASARRRARRGPAHPDRRRRRRPRSRRAGRSRIGALDVIELSIPLASLGAKAHDDLRAWMTMEFAGVTFARVPRDGAINVQIPWAGWEEENWSA